MILNLSELSDEPLHAQVSRQIRAKILSKDMTGGDPLPSIRSLAREQRVSVITVQRAYDDLDTMLVHLRDRGIRLGIVTSKRARMVGSCTTMAVAG